VQDGARLGKEFLVWLGVGFEARPCALRRGGAWCGMGIMVHFG
jgi:hypothetical protein